MRPPESWQRARVTLAIAAITTAAWLAATGLGLTATPDSVVYAGGFIPARAGSSSSDIWLMPFVLTPLTAALIHADFFHLLFNLLFLLFCGRSVENIIGGRGTMILYLVGAYAAAAAVYAAAPSSTTVGFGASGAVSAIVGAYAMLFGRQRVQTADPRIGLWLHALWLAAAWIGLQALLGVASRLEGVGISVAAHIGGFLIGLALAKPLLLLRWRGA
jgi:membrane associated rhomboid family serine protease